MEIDALVYEIGSTTTIINAFDKLDSVAIFLGSAMTMTTVDDISIGVLNALENLKVKLNTKELVAKETYATSSAAGGLKMSVHALVYEMTVKAAVEACLGAGANAVLITAGTLSCNDLLDIKEKRINIILIAGGVDYGDKETALNNSRLIAELKLNIPVIYAGNIQNIEAVKRIFKSNNQDKYLYITENIYPKLDHLNVQKARVIIQQVFEEHITKANGLEKIRSIVSNSILPTPGAVMNAAILLQSELGDLVVIDIGGATTDVSSVASDNLPVISPEPFSKRTVEGDLGLFINKDNLLNLYSKMELLKELKISDKELDEILNNYQYIPNENQLALVEMLTKTAFEKAMIRHSGYYKTLFTTKGQEKLPIGKDLTAVKYLIGTGGALINLPNSKKMIESFIKNTPTDHLLPSKETIILIDHDYIMASLGALAKKHPRAAIILLKKSLRLE